MPGPPLLNFIRGQIKVLRAAFHPHTGAGLPSLVHEVTYRGMAGVGDHHPTARYSSQTRSSSYRDLLSLYGTPLRDDLVVLPSGSPESVLIAADN